MKIGVSAVYNGLKFEDSLTMPVKVLPKGFARQYSQGGSLGSQNFTKENPTSTNFTVPIPNSIEEGYAKVTAKIFSSIFASLLSAVEALI